MTATTQIQHLKTHPAQMRTEYDQEGMAALTLQVFQRGLDSWQPIVAAPAGEKGDYRIISGHRRRMARLFAFALEDWASEHPEQDVTVEVARTLIAALSRSSAQWKRQPRRCCRSTASGRFPLCPLPATARRKSSRCRPPTSAGKRRTCWVSPTASARRWRAGRRRKRLPATPAVSVHYVLNHLALIDIPRSWRSASPPASCL